MKAPRLAALGLLVLLAPLRVSAQDETQSIRAKQDALWNRAQDSIRSVVQKTDAVVGVAILDLTDQRSFFLNADATYPTASTIKLAVLAELYRQNERAESGGAGAKLDDLYTLDAKDRVGGDGVLQAMTPGVTRLTNRDLAALVAGLSDNMAANVLIDRVGMDNVNTWLAGLGLKETRLRRHMMDVAAAREGRENTATPRELVTLLKSIYDGKVFRKATTDDFLKLLSVIKKSYIPRLLPADLTIANKPGDLDGVRNDAAIVFCPGRPFAIVVMVTFARDEVAAEDSIALIAQAAWSYFDRVGRSSPLGRVIN
ncbi:MAG TPA: serine hydrolase [Steroidobacteraceae bacterium]|nr:serine hydrolase [Steroidobacteraceae bacterium]